MTMAAMFNKAPPLAAWFKRHDIELQQATRPGIGLKLLAQGGWDAAILDVMLPEMDGFERCRTIRKTSQLPLLMLTARGEVMDRVVGLEWGADDYLPKPFKRRALLARLQTVLRRTQAAGQATPAPGGRLLRFAGLRIDLAARSVQCESRNVNCRAPRSNCWRCWPAGRARSSAATTS